MRAVNEATFEELRNRLTGDAPRAVAPLTADQAEELRARVVAAHEHYHATGAEGAPERDSDELVDALRHVAEVRSGSGSNMPFARALAEVLAEVQEAS